MSLYSLKRDIFRIKQKLGDNFENLNYESALERHEARFKILYAENVGAALDTLDEVIESLDQSEIDPSYDYSSLGQGDRLRQEAEKAYELLGVDTPERWQNDQKMLVTYHLNLYGNLSHIKSQNAFGSTPDEMWAHYESNVFASRDEEEKSKRLSKEETKTRRAEIEKEYGKPVRLHPDPTNYTYKNYVPQFSEGAPRWDLRRVYPYEDFPEHDGKSIIELEGSD